MKKISLTPTEFCLFRQIANFLYTYAVSSGIILIEADAKLLENLGY